MSRSECHLNQFQLFIFGWPGLKQRDTFTFAKSTLLLKQNNILDFSKQICIIWNNKLPEIVQSVGVFY